VQRARQIVFLVQRLQHHLVAVVWAILLQEVPDRVLFVMVLLHKTFGLGGVAKFTLEVLVVLHGAEVAVLLLKFVFKPGLQTNQVDPLHAAFAGAEGHQRIFLSE